MVKKEETKEAAIHELLTRGVEKVFPSADFLRARLKSGERLRVYFGVDPTGPTLHIGHIIPLLALRRFQDLGHRIIFLIGDFTATVGDPTDKLAVRTAMTHQGVLANAHLYKAQAEKIISFEGENPAEIRYNAEWLSKLSFAEVVVLATHLTHANLVKRDMFQKRIEAGKELYLHEFLYPLMQGYDSVAMGVDGEVGGNDQTYNMLVGRDLAKKISGKEKFVLATKLLTDAMGAKMGKTSGNMLALTDTSADMFGKVMSWPDDMIARGFELCTRVPLSEIPTQEHPKEAKTRLAFEIVSLLRGAEEATHAQKSFHAAFGEGKPKEFVDIPQRGAAEALVEKKIVESKSDLRRLIAEGAITSVATDEKIGEAFLKNPVAGEYRIGKHRFVRIVAS